MSSSINEQQPEKNHENLQGKDAAAKIKELTEKANTCFFCTTLGERPFSTRPMSIQKADDDGTLWFMSANDSTLNDDLAKDNKSQLLFQEEKYSGFLVLNGNVTVSQDKAKIKELWDPTLKTWFTEGEDDPRISVLKFTPEEGYYWDTKHGQFVSFAKRMVGAVIGKTLDDSIEGRIDL